MPKPNNEDGYFTLSRLSHTDIDIDYLETLNDKKYCRLSSISQILHTKVSQAVFIERSYSKNSILIGARNAAGLIMATSLLKVDELLREVNIGLLVLKKYSGSGLGTRFVRSLLDVIPQIAPGYTPVIGTNKDNHAMKRIAQACGFSFCRETVDTVYFSFPPTMAPIYLGIPPVLSNAKTIGVFCSDPGSARFVVDLISNFNSKDITVVCENVVAREYFNANKIKITKLENIHWNYFDTYVLGTGHGSELENMALEMAKKLYKPKIYLLDHFVNYRQRFLDSKLIREIVLVEDLYAAKIASGSFPNFEIWALDGSTHPMLQISSLRDYLDTNHNRRTKILIPLDTLDSSCFFDFYTLHLATLEKVISILKGGKNYRGQSLAVRIHPSEKQRDFLIKWLISQDCLVSDPKEKVFSEELQNFDTIIGFNSFTLFEAAQKGKKVYSFFAEEFGHWISTVNLIGNERVL